MVTGEELYNMYFEMRNHANFMRGDQREPRWKDLKPWLKNVWNRTATKVNDASSST